MWRLPLTGVVLPVGGSISFPVEGSSSSILQSSSTPFSPESIFSGGVGGAWFTAYDNTYLKVNSDGTGGAVASGGTVGQWEDRSGNGNHLSQVTANVRPVFAANKGVSFFWRTDGGTTRSDIRNVATDSFDKQNMSGGMSVWVHGSNQCPVLDIGASDMCILVGRDTGQNRKFVDLFCNAATFSSTGLKASARKMVITWRCTGTDVIVRVNGSEYLRGSALTAGSASRIIMSSFNGGNPKPSRMFETVMFDEDVGQDSILELEGYLRASAGEFDEDKVVAIYGDSLSMGIGSETGNAWHFDITNRSDSVWRSYAADGGFIFSQHVLASNLVGDVGATEGVCVLWIGTNDINSGTRTGLQTAANIKAYSDALRVGGWKTVVCTLQDFPNNEAERLACNAQIAVDAASYDAIADLAAAPELDDCTDTTYFTSDQVHLKDAGYAAVTALIETALASVA